MDVAASFVLGRPVQRRPVSTARSHRLHDLAAEWRRTVPRLPRPLRRRPGLPVYGEYKAAVRHQEGAHQRVRSQQRASLAKAECLIVAEGRARS